MISHDLKLSSDLGKFDYIAAGAGSGFLTRIATQPFDVLKIRFQLQVEPLTVHNPHSKYRGFFQAVKCIYQEEGVTAFWKGFSPGICMGVTYGALQFTTFEILTKYVSTRVPETLTQDPKFKPVATFLCGSLSGIAATIGSYPFDVLRTRMVGQGNFKIYRGIPEAVKIMLRQEGPRGFYKGLSPNILHTIPASGLRFALYKLLEDSWRIPEGKVKFYHLLFYGFFAGFGAKATLYPMDVIKKRMQVQGFEEARKHFGEIDKYYGAIDCAWMIWQKEGFLAFYKGLTPSVAKSCVATSCYFFSYAQIRAFQENKKKF